MSAFNTARPRKLSREATIAIGASLAVHLGVGAYMGLQKFVYAEPAIQIDEPRATEIEMWRPQERKVAPPKPRPAAVAVHRPTTQTQTHEVEPIHVPPQPPTTTEQTLTPPILATDTGPVEVADLTPPALPQPPRVIRNPTWVAKPTSTQMARLYPPLALERGLDGGATLMCEVIASGSVRNCAVIDEHPKGRGFGEAALASSKHFRLNPRTENGEAIEGARVRIPLVFNLAD